MKRNELEGRIGSIYYFLAYKYKQKFGEGNDRTIYLNYVNYPSLRAYIKWHDIERNTRDDLPVKEILQNPPQCLVHVSMQWHPHRP